MVDPVVELFDREPDRDKRARSLKLGPARDKMRQAFAEAFLQAMRRAAAEKAALAGSSTEIASLANAFADVALGESVVLRLNPDRLGEGRGAVKAFLETLVRVSRASDQSRLEAAIEKLAEVILPDDLGIARGALASDNLNLRDRFIAETPQLTSADVGRMSGLRTKNPYATAARWKKSGDIFSVRHRGVEYLPAFQFRDGRPHPTIKKALEALPGDLSDWQRALWFVSANGWLADEAPAEVLDAADAVVAAARHEGEEVIG